MDLLINAGALRQYRHNDNSGFVFGYDKEITDRVIADMQAELEVWKDLTTVAFVCNESTQSYKRAYAKFTELETGNEKS